MKTFNLPSFFKVTAVLLLFTLFGFQQQATAQLNVQNNTGCWVLVGEYFGTGCNICNNANGTWLPPGPSQLAIPACLTAVFPPARWIAVKYGVAPFPGPFVGPGSISYNPFGGACSFSQNNSNCGGNPVVAFWTGPNNIVFQ